MNHQHKNLIVRNSLRGFNLIELMVVITLIALLVGGATVLLMGQLEKGKISTARTQAYEIAKSLNLYMLQVGSYPSASEGLEVLVNPPKGAPLMDEIPLDPWGNEYNYAIPGTHNPKGFDVWSNGPSGTEGEESDIGNWRPAEENK